MRASLKRPLLHAVLPLLVLAAFAVSAAHAIPSSFTISGVLKDGTGALLPDASNVAVEIVFYDSETTGTLLGTTSTTCNIRKGVFTAIVHFPPALLSESQLWYSMAIDTDGNGIDSGDLFPGRFFVASVPFALSSQPVDYFNTHGGSIGLGGDLVPNRVEVCPFITPPGGVEFNRVAFRIGALASSDKLGNIAIYDSEGNQVYATQPFLATYDTQVPSSGGLFIVTVEESSLLPSQTYFTAVVSTSNRYYASWGVNPTWPFAGTNDLFTTNASLPETIDPVTLKMGIPYNLALFKVDEGAKTVAPKSKTAGHTKEGYPIYYPVADDPAELHESKGDHP